MKKIPKGTVIAWLIALLFFFSSFSLLFEGKFGSFFTGIIIFAGLALWGWIIFKKSLPRNDYNFPHPPLNRMNYPSNNRVNRNKKQFNLSDLYIHEDIIDLIFTKENIDKYSPLGRNERNVYINVNSKVISEEPSLVDETLPVDFNADISITPKLPYNPSYSNISPAQRGVYLKFLENPYNDEYEIGYTFILFYGLERHLIYGNSVRAIEIIHKLREYHANQSFLFYSFNAMLFYYAKDKKFSFVLSEEYDNLDVNYIIHFHMQTDKMLTAETIMKFRKSFGFRKEALILKNSELFREELTNLFNEFFGIETLPLKAYNFSACTAINNLSFPANITLEKLPINHIKVLNYVEMPKFKTDICSMLEEVYETVKTKGTSKNKN